MYVLPEVNDQMAKILRIAPQIMPMMSIAMVGVGTLMLVILVSHQGPQQVKIVLAHLVTLITVGVQEYYRIAHL